MPDKIKVLFLCIGNSCRSQMAEGLLRHLAGERFEVESAGTIPCFVHPRAIEVMGELGVDISGQRSKHVQEFQGQSFDYVISLCGENNCPSFIGKTDTSLHWPFPDPISASGTEEKVLGEFRTVRDAIRTKLEEFIADPGSFSSGGTEFLISKDS